MNVTSSFINENENNAVYNYYFLEKYLVIIIILHDTSRQETRARRMQSPLFVRRNLEFLFKSRKYVVTSSVINDFQNNMSLISILIVCIDMKRVFFLT